MANTMTLIASVTVGGSGSSNIYFSSIPNTYTDLLLVFSLRTNNAANTNNSRIGFNSSGSGFSSKFILGNSSTASSGNGISTAYYTDSIFSNGDNATGGAYNSGQIYIPNYKSTSQQKSFSIDSVTENNSGSAGAVATSMAAGLFSDTSAINYIEIFPSSSGSFNPNSTVYLYGIKNS